jgi:hypothetical protein
MFLIAAVLATADAASSLASAASAELRVYCKEETSLLVDIASSCSIDIASYYSLWW